MASGTTGVLVMTEVQNHRAREEALFPVFPQMAEDEARRFVQGFIPLLIATLKKHDPVIERQRWEACIAETIRRVVADREWFVPFTMAQWRAHLQSALRNVA